MILPARPPKKRNETRDLTHPIRVALNRMPGVRVARNNTGVLEDQRGVKLRYGLGLGSADLVGIVTVRVLHELSVPDHGGQFLDDDYMSLGRYFALEVKWPGERPTEDQERWLQSVRELGGFACVVHSVEEAIAAVGRCRNGESQ